MPQMCFSWASTSEGNRDGRIGNVWGKGKGGVGVFFNRDHEFQWEGLQKAGGERRGKRGDGKNHDLKGEEKGTSQEVGTWWGGFGQGGETSIQY